MPNTEADFWRMIWEKKLNNIVMLTYMLITSILAGLMENDLSKIMDFDDFFNEIENCICHLNNNQISN
ncbi:MAG: hypothetical protein A6F71_08235 [Cycloclasticus sp. symbiont of Poecilosclerida sp. M]|nr:MAG: hypothetical protein A6F71_08235 [Cycloclasticus sp. symbiont of Poecilosclerida sp. M]